MPRNVANFENPESGLIFRVVGPGRVGGHYSNSEDLKNYLKKKAKEGFKLESVEQSFPIMNSSKKKIPCYMVFISKDPKDWGME